MAKKPRQTVSYVLEVTEGRHDGHRLGVNAVAVDSNCSTLYSGGRDGRLCAWDLNLPHTQKPSVADTSSGTATSSCTTFRRQILQHIHWVNDIALIDDTALVSASTDLNVKLWMPHSNTQDTHTLGQHTDHVKRLAYPAAGTPGHGEWIASGGWDRKVHLWDLTGKGSKLTIDTSADGVGEKGSVYALAVGPNMVAAGGPSRIVTLWDTRTGDRINHFIGHTDMIRSVLIDQAGETMISASTDSTVKVWSTKNFKCLNTLYMHETSVWSLCSEDPRLRVFYSADKDGLLAKTDIRNADEYLEHGSCVAVGREDGGIVNLASGGGHIWTATAKPSFNRWRDVCMDSDITSEGHRRKKSSATYRPSHGRQSSLEEDPEPLSQRPIPPQSFLSLTNPPLYDRSEYRNSKIGTLHSLSPSAEDKGAADGCLQGQPVHDAPEETVEGFNGVVGSQMLKNRRNVLTVDTAGEVVMWDIIQCRRVKSFGMSSVKAVQAQVDVQPLSTDPWCTVDTSSGSLVVTLNPNDCFSAEMYLDELKCDERVAAEFREDQRVNLGKWVLRYLFANLVNTEIRRDEEYRRSLTEKTVSPRPSLPCIRIPTSPGGGADTATPRASSARYTPLSPGAITGIGTPGTSGLSNILEGSDKSASPRAPASRRPSLAALGAVGESADYFGTEAVPPLSVEGAAKTTSPANPTSPGPQDAEAFKRASGDDGRRDQDAEKDADKTPSTPFTKFFSRPMAFGRKRSASIASEKRAAVADSHSDARVPDKTTQPEEKADESETSDAELEDSFMSVIKRIRSDYDRHIRERPNKKAETRLTPSMPADAPVLRISPGVKIVIREETDSALSNVYQGTVGSVGNPEDTNVVERRGAGWLAELLLLNLPLSPNKDSDEKKVSFVLLPYPELDMPVIAGPDGRIKTESSPLTAYRLLRVRKVLAYVSERLGEVTIAPASGDGEESQTGGLPPPEDFLELYCQGKRLDPLMTLLHIKKFLWKGSGDVELFYRVNDRWTCTFGDKGVIAGDDAQKESGAVGGEAAEKVSEDVPVTAQESGPSEKA